MAISNHTSIVIEDILRSSASIRQLVGSSLYEGGASVPDHPTWHWPFCRRRMETIGTHHRVLDISTVDTPSCRTHAGGFSSQIVEGFADEQSPAALTEHTSSFLVGES
ncbi:MAG TPA: hypothetical protein VIW47_06730 [Nitrospiraceae bacterium]